MVQKSQIISLMLTGVLAFISISLWLYEVSEFGWDNIAWVYKDKKSAYVISSLISLAFILPFIANNRAMKCYKLFTAFIVLSITNYGFYRIGKYCLTMLYTAPFNLVDIFFWGFMFLLIILSLFSFIYLAVVNTLLMKTRNKMIFLFALSVLLSMIIAEISISIFPGFGYGTGFIDAIKMGYPMFWACMFMGVTGMILANKKDHPLE